MGAILLGVKLGSGFRADAPYHAVCKYAHSFPTGAADSSPWLSAPGLGWGGELVGVLRTQGPARACCLTLKRPTMRSSSVPPSSSSPVLPRSRLNVCSQSSKLSNSDSSSLGYT